jgi:hypothetical protein
MVMSVLVNREGKICVAHDVYYEGAPVGLSYETDNKTLTLHMDNGIHECLGMATLPEIARRLRGSKQVTLMQICRPEPVKQVEVPLYIHIQK